MQLQFRSWMLAALTLLVVFLIFADISEIEEEIGMTWNPTQNHSAHVPALATCARKDNKLPTGRTMVLSGGLEGSREWDPET
ncbi:hypothetical protein STEG23_036534 [Scotinomys teguina]